MAHGKEKRTQLRGLYVYKRLPMDEACRAADVPRGTANRWKTMSRAEGDDWDAARSAVALGDESFGQMSRKLLEDYLVHHQAVMDELKKDKTIKPSDAVDMLARLSDSFTKTIAAFKRVSPELNRHAVALDALQRLAGFAQQRFPQHVGVLIEMLEPFGEELAKAYG